MTGYAMPNVATVVEHCATGGRYCGDSSQLRGSSGTYGFDSLATALCAIGLCFPMSRLSGREPLSGKDRLEDFLILLDPLLTPCGPSKTGQACLPRRLVFPLPSLPSAVAGHCPSMGEGMRRCPQVRTMPVSGELARAGGKGGQAGGGRGTGVKMR